MEGLFLMLIEETGHASASIVIGLGDLIPTGVVPVASSGKTAQD